MLALMQPAAAVVFALDGILIGAGDTRYLAGSMLLAGVAVYVPIALLALALDWGVTGVWAGLLALVGVRLVTLGWRFAGGRWAVIGAAVDRAPGASEPNAAVMTPAASGAAATVRRQDDPRPRRSARTSRPRFAPACGGVGSPQAER